MTKAAAGMGGPRSRVLTRVAMTSPPPTDSPREGVEVQDDMTGFDPVDGDPGRGDAAQCRCGHGHIGGPRLRRQQMPKLSPLLIDVAVGGEG
ncbi:hypothetical protein ACIA98_41740 [Streptomyces sp. NPDC051366]|uniref:hypothetical protein n=1 Tax=Streptomyces sp. NPDC051366 TaxID=3365652 RepID=UPI0037BA76FA